MRLVSRFPEDPPRFLARIPHGYSDADKIRAELMAAGFTTITGETIEETSRAPSARDVAMAYCQGTPLRNEIEARGGSLEEATDIAAEALQRQGFDFTFWLGNQGLEYTSMGRVWQILLFVGLLFWLLLLGRAAVRLVRAAVSALLDP